MCPPWRIAVVLTARDNIRQVTAMRINRANNKGAAMVEFAIVALLLVTLVFGIIEFGLLIKDYLAINHAAREGARSAALGSPTSVIIARVQNTAPGMTIPLEDITLTTGSPTSAPDTWTTTLENTADGKNNAVHGNLILVRVSYDHQMIAGGLFNNGAPISISGKMIMRRE